MIRVIAFAFLLVFLCLLFRKKEDGIAFLLLIAGAIVLFSMAYEEIATLYSQLEKMLEPGDDLPIYLKQFMKILAITYLADFGASICKDAGYQTLGKQVEILGKIFILTLTVPLLLTVMDTVFSLF